MDVDFENMTTPGNACLLQSPKSAPDLHKRFMLSSNSVSGTANAADCSDGDDEGPRKKRKVEHPDVNLSIFETLPNEVLQEVASYLVTDQDLRNFTLTCTAFASSIIPDNSGVWKARFLARYDHPITDAHNDFCVAYKLRRFVLRKSIDFSSGKDARVVVLLEVLRDMVLETYHIPKPHLLAPTASRNLAAFSSPDNSPWMVKFLSSPFFDHGSRPFGRPNTLFDALQLTFSHLLLSQSSRIAHAVNTSRDNYDLVKVYNWNIRFSTLYTRFQAAGQEMKEHIKGFQTSLFPNLKIQSHGPTAPAFREKLDLYSLLHIRNFWHRHLVDDSNGFLVGDTGERTFADMGRCLRKLGQTPRQWERALQDGDDGTKGLLSGEWYGHYSCLHPWPKLRRDLNERQTCAEDWNHVDPLKLDFATTTDNKAECFWPPIFSTIPAFSTTTPDPSDFKAKTVFLRGIAPFIDLSTIHKVKDTGSSTSSPQTSKYHPFQALRLRGIVHPIPTQAQIPGWQRIILVLYKPSTRYLIQVLEHHDEDYGNPFSATITNQIQTQPHPNTQTQGASQPTPHSATQPPAQTSAPVQQQTLPLSNTNIMFPPTTAAQNLSPIETHKLLQKHLSNLLDANPNYHASSLDRDTIEEMEEQFSMSEYLDWTDIDYAYAYEGIILPGGKIMLGRWWRIGEMGTGPGKEVDVEGQDVEAVDEHGTPQDGGDGELAGNASAAGRARSNRGLERGPFVFWC